MRVGTSLVFLAAALFQWLVRHNGAFAIVWCFVALVPLSYAVGGWHEMRKGPAIGEPEAASPPEATQP